MGLEPKEQEFAQFGNFFVDYLLDWTAGQLVVSFLRQLLANFFKLFALFNKLLVLLLQFLAFRTWCWFALDCLGDGFAVDLSAVIERRLRLPIDGESFEVYLSFLWFFAQGSCAG